MFLASSPSAAFTAGRGTPYLFTHHNSPAFRIRIRIPADLQSCLGKTEYRRSLGRCYAREAKLRALRLATAALEIFSFARAAIQTRENKLLSQCLELETTREQTNFRPGGSTGVLKPSSRPKYGFKADVLEKCDRGERHATARPSPLNRR